MAEVVDITVSDRLEVGHTDTRLELGYADRITLTEDPNRIKVGANDSLTVAPFQSATSLNLKIPQSVVEGVASIESIRDSLLAQIGNMEIAIANAKQYIDTIENNVRTQVLTEMETSYVANNDLEAKILATDLSNMRIVTEYDSNGNPLATATLQDISDRYLNVENSFANYTSVVDGAVTNSSSAISKTEELSADVSGVKATITSGEYVAVGGFTQYTTGTPETGQWRGAPGSYEQWRGYSWVPITDAQYSRYTQQLSIAGAKSLSTVGDAIVGWEYANGGEGDNEFKIKADRFYLESAVSTTKSAYVPFSVDAISGEINFNGRVEFSSVNNAPSTFVNGKLPIDAIPGSTAVVYELYKDNNNLDIPITIKYGTAEPVATEAYLHNIDDIQIVPTVLPGTKLVITPYDNSATKLIGESDVGLDEVSFSGNMIESIQVYNEVTGTMDKYFGADMVDMSINFNSTDPISTVSNSIVEGAMVVEPDGTSVRLFMPDYDLSHISYKTIVLDAQKQPLSEYAGIPETYSTVLIAWPLLEDYITNSTNTVAYLRLTRHNSNTLAVDFVAEVKMSKTDTYGVLEDLSNSFRLTLATDVNNLNYAYAIKFNNREFADIVSITPSELNVTSISEIAFSKYPDTAKILALTKAGNSTYILTKSGVEGRFGAFIATTTYGVFSDISFFGEGYLYIDGANITGTYVSEYDDKLSGFSNYKLKEISYIRTLENKWHRVSDSTSITTSTLTNALARPTTIIDGGRIKTDTIDARSIVANSITSEQITTGTLRGLQLEGGEVRGGAIYGAYIKGAVIEGAVIQSSFIEAGVTSRFISDSVAGTDNMLYIDTVTSEHLSDPVVVKPSLLPFADNLAKITLGGSDYLVTSEVVSAGVFNRYFRLECNKTFISASIEKVHRISAYYQWAPVSAPISTSLTRYDDYTVKTLNRLVKASPLLHVNETALLSIPGGLGTDDLWTCAVGVFNDYTIWLQGSRNDLWTMTATVYAGNVAISDRSPVGTPTVVGSYTVVEYWNESDKIFSLSGITFKLSLGKSTGESSWDDNSGYSMGWTSHHVNLSIITQDFTLSQASVGEIVVRDCSVLDSNTSNGVVGYVTLAVPTITEIL